VVEPPIQSTVIKTDFHKKESSESLKDFPTERSPLRKRGGLYRGQEVWVVDRGVTGLHIRKGVVHQASTRTEHMWSEEHWVLSFASLARYGDYPASRIHPSRELATRSMQAIQAREGLNVGQQPVQQSVQQQVHTKDPGTMGEAKPLVLQPNPAPRAPTSKRRKRARSSKEMTLHEY